MADKPLQFSKEDLDQLLHQEVEINIGDIDDDEDYFAYKGKIVSYSFTEEGNMPDDFCFYTDNGALKHYNFSVLKKLRKL